MLIDIIAVASAYITLTAAVAAFTVRATKEKRDERYDSKGRKKN